MSVDKKELLRLELAMNAGLVALSDAHRAQQDADTRLIWTRRVADNATRAFIKLRDERVAEELAELDSHEQTEHLGSGPIPSGQCTESERVENSELRGRDEAE